jgi:hypothetical protein
LFSKESKKLEKFFSEIAANKEKRDDLPWRRGAADIASALEKENPGSNLARV